MHYCAQQSPTLVLTSSRQSLRSCLRTISTLLSHMHVRRSLSSCPLHSSFQPKISTYLSPLPSVGHIPLSPFSLICYHNNIFRTHIMQHQKFQFEYKFDRTNCLTLRWNWRQTNEIPRYNHVLCSVLYYCVQEEKFWVRLRITVLNNKHEVSATLCFRSQVSKN